MRNLNKFKKFFKNACNIKKNMIKLLCFDISYVIGGAKHMAKCDICGKGVTFGIKVSHSHRRANRAWKPNVKKVRAIVNGNTKSINVCTRCLRSGKVTRAV